MKISCVRLLGDPLKLEGYPGSMPSNDPGLPGPIPPLRIVPQTLEDALQVCVSLASLSPQATVASFIAAGMALMSGALNTTGGYLGLASQRAHLRDDPVHGWRLEVFYGFGAHVADEIRKADELIQSEDYIHDPGIQATVRDAGRHRVYHDPDPRMHATRAGSIDAQVWETACLTDRLKLVYALSPSLELHFAFDRRDGAPPFQPHEVAALDTMTKGLEPWCRRVALLHGLLPGQSMLSPRERDLTCALLGHDGLKNAAARLGISEARAREVARSVYRKLQVDGRLGLAGAWTGTFTEATVAPISRPLLRRRRRR